jgi:hypothetical protein
MFSKLLFVALLALTVNDANAHTRLKAGGLLVPRSNDAGIKVGPCGGLTRLSTPASLVAGETITVQWEETVQHPGHFEFYFSKANDENFELLKMIPDDQDDPATLPHQYSTTLKVPGVACESCTIQLIQVMTENPSSPRPYFSCADIRIHTRPATPVASPTPVLTPEPPPRATATPPLLTDAPCH